MNDYKYEYTTFQNRWRQPKYARNSEWLIFGIYKWWCGWDRFCYKLGFLGFEIKIWYKHKEAK